MREFVNRQAKNLNRKSFEVEKIEKDNKGDIIRIIGKFLRDDDATIEGTPLDAKNLLLAVKKYFCESSSVTIAKGETGTITIDIAKTVTVDIQNDYANLFTVTSSTSDDTVTLKVEPSPTITIEGATEYDFRVVLTSQETGRALGVVTCTVILVATSTNPSD